MEALLLVVALFQTIVILALGVVFTYLAFKLFNLETNILPTKESEDVFTSSPRVPIDQFIPKAGEELTVKYSEKDNIHAKN